MQNIIRFLVKVKDAAINQINTPIMRYQVEIK